MRRAAFALAAALIGLPLLARAVPDTPAQGPWRPSGSIPIMTWGGPDAALLTPEVFRGMAAAGFNVNFSALGDDALNLKVLDLARAAGMKALVHDTRIQKLVEDEILPLDPLEAVVRDYQNHPALFGYYIQDEPSAGKFTRLGQIVRRLAALDPRHPSYINLFPTYANEQQLGVKTYEEHYSRYLEAVRPPFVSYDHYPVTTEGLRRDYYRNLEIIRRGAMDKGLDWWAFTLSTAHGPYPQATAAHIRLQLFSDLAYGAKALQYFTYATPKGTDFAWQSGLMKPDGMPGPSYEAAREVNAEVRRIEKLVIRWTSRSVEHSAPVPDGAKPVGGEGPVVAASGAPIVIGMLADGGATYVMLVNRDYERARTAILTFAAGVKGIREIPKSDAAPVRISWGAGGGERVCALEFAAGDARIFRIE